jgi:hypothetical protein
MWILPHRADSRSDSVLKKYLMILNDKVLCSFISDINKNCYRRILSSGELSCSPLEVIRHFGGTCHLHLQGFFLLLFFDHEDGGRRLLGNAGKNLRSYAV